MTAALAQLVFYTPVCLPPNNPKPINPEDFPSLPRYAGALADKDLGDAETWRFLRSLSFLLHGGLREFGYLIGVLMMRGFISGVLHYGKRPNDLHRFWCLGGTH